MSIFSAIMGKIFHPADAAQPAPPASAVPSAPQPSSAQATTVPAAAATQVSPQDVDVEAVLTQMAAQKGGGGGNWQTSIVDLLKLLGLDSSLEARRQLAQELVVHAGADGSAEQNMALHKAVMRKLAENGGKVPDSLK